MLVNETNNRKEVAIGLRNSSFLSSNTENNTQEQLRKQKIHCVLICAELFPHYISNWKRLTETGIHISFQSSPHNDSDYISTLQPLRQRKSTKIVIVQSAQLPLETFERKTIKIPAKVEHAISKYASKEALRGISHFEDEAVELCLFFLSNLSNTSLIATSATSEAERQGWKHLKATYLDEQLGGCNYTLRKKIIDLLLKGTKKGPIIELDKTYQQGSHSMSYRLAGGYLHKGVVRYEVKSNRVNNLIIRHQDKLELEVRDNSIIQNLKCLYPRLKFPSTDEILIEARRLIDLGYHTKKGLRLTFQNKHSKKYFVNPDRLSFVEDCISIYNYLTEGELIRPSVSNKAGGRVTDGLNLMPGWIRNLIRIDGVRIQEVDFVALHPNIAISLYSGMTQNITHGAVATQFGLPISIVKQEHLSFFNKNIFLMEKSPLFNFYSKQEPEMLKRIIAEKRSYGHKATTIKLFESEVNIMTDVIKRLNEKGIYVGYVYDALLCKVTDTSVVLKTMNETISEHGICTTAKVDLGNLIN